MIYAIVTLYNPTNNIVQNIKKISNQSDKVYICDNSIEYNNILFTDFNNCIYIHNGRNLGLSAAFNKVLLNKNYGFDKEDYIFFFDQDTSIPEGHINKIIAEYSVLEERYHKIGCIGPIYHNDINGKIEIPRHKKKLSNYSFSVKSLITSSMMCKYGKLEEVGFWNNNIFLDMADFDLCWRLINKGYICCITLTSIINHSVGEGEKNKFFHRIRIENPIRDYYQTRDSLYLLDTKYVPFKYRIRIWDKLYIRPIIYRLIMPDYNVRKKYISMGRDDYKKKIHGEIPKRHLSVAEGINR